MKKVIDDERRQLLDKLSEEPTMVLAAAYVYAKNYVLYGEDITKSWTTAVQQAAILEQVRLKAFTDAYDSFKKDYENRLKADMVAMLEEIDLEMNEQSFGIQTEPWEVVEKLRKEIIQQKINVLKAESEE